LSQPEIVVRRTASIGDCVCATVVLDKLREHGFESVYQTHGNIHAVVRLCPSVHHLQTPKGFAHVNLDACYERDPNRRHRHFHDMFIGTAAAAMRSYGVDIGTPCNSVPRLVLDLQAREVAKAKFADLPKPWIGFVPRSNSYIVRQVPDLFWRELSQLLPGTSIWFGQHPAPEGIVDLKLQSLTPLVHWLSAMDILVSVDTGPMHIASALGVPIIALGQSSSPELHLSDQTDFQTVYPAAHLDCINCQQNICPKSRYSPPCQVFSAENVARIVRLKCEPQTISALIPTFNPDPHAITKTILNVVDQVDEVVVTAALDAQNPLDIPPHPKVRLVRANKTRLGFGKNVNFGFRHTHGRWVLLLNDDCYLSGDAVDKLKLLRADNVGMIAHLLRYPNGQIYFAGRHRRPGDRGFPHIDHRSYDPQIKTVSEMEALSATSVLINRQAFYQIGGFDERFFMYAEDDDISLRMRQAGYQLLYQPDALGVHEGSLTVRKTGQQGAWIKESAKLMEKLWGWYWTQNSNKIPGVFK
jgi:GT2 family glycosyltransferase/ADP-heptose:LPS heptosyltransferase